MELLGELLEGERTGKILSELLGDEGESHLLALQLEGWNRGDGWR